MTGFYEKLQTQTQSLKITASVFRRKPLFLFRVIKNYLKAMMPGPIKPLRFVDISITHACNFNCVHCSEKNLERSHNSQISPAQYQKLANNLMKEGALLFHFTGGEPLIRKDLEEILAAFSPHKNMLSIQSNASLATKERLSSLKKAGLDMFCVSLDAACAQDHDAFRQHPGSYDKCLQALQDAKEAGLKTSISTVVTHSNLHSNSLNELIKLAKETKSILYLNLAIPIGNFDCQHDLLTPDDRLYLEELIRNNPCRTDFETTYYKRGCSALKEKLYLTPEGNVIPCPFIHVTCGNIHTESIRQIRTQGLKKIPELSNYLPYCPAAENTEFQSKYGYRVDSKPI